MDVRDGIFGLAVADALGVPAEFTERGVLRESPVTEMRGGGAHCQPKGTWSDDTSMALCLADSLAAGCVDYVDIMEKFCRWWVGGEYTPHGYAFDIGGTTGAALSRFREGTPPLLCGGKAERSNGNGGLMRILPAAYYVRPMLLEKGLDIVHNLTALTHAHPRSIVASGIYVRICIALMEGDAPADAVRRGMEECAEYYQDAPYAGEWRHFARLAQGIAALPEDAICSSGYVVHTLEAAVWCLLTTDSYRECVLRAINLGGDADTVGAVAGGLAGIRFGLASIPQEWVEALVRRNIIESICASLQQRLG